MKWLRKPWGRFCLLCRKLNAFNDRIGNDIRVKQEITEVQVSDDSPLRPVGVDDVLEAEKEYSKSKARNAAWFSGYNREIYDRATLFKRSVR